MTDLDAIRARHVRVDNSVDPQYGVSAKPDECAMADGYWPCDTAVVLAALDVALAQLSGAVPSDGEPQPRATVEASDDPALDAAIEREARLRAALEFIVAEPSMDKTGRMRAIARAALATTPASAPVEPTAEGE